MKAASWPAGFLLLLVATCSDANAVFDNGVGVDTMNASDSTLPNLVADDFLLQAGANVFNRIRWTGVYASGNTPNGPDDFTIEVYADDAGVPSAGPPLYTFAVGQPLKTDTGDDLGAFDIYAYSAGIAPLALAPGTTWWLSIVNDTGADADDFWFWAGEGKVGNAQERTSSQFPWTAAFLFAADFELLSEVAEPSGLGLLGIGLAGLAIACRRRRQIRPLSL